MPLVQHFLLLVSSSHWNLASARCLQLSDHFSLFSDYQACCFTWDLDHVCKGRWVVGKHRAWNFLLRQIIMLQDWSYVLGFDLLDLFLKFALFISYWISFFIVPIKYLKNPAFSFLDLIFWLCNQDYMTFVVVRSEGGIEVLEFLLCFRDIRL